MASYLQIENISKSYGPKILFENIGFNINEGDKIALIAPNGTGKTSLLRILAGKDKSDSGGKIIFLKNIRIAFLEQEYDYDPEKDIFSQIMEHSSGFVSGLDQEGIIRELLAHRPLASKPGEKYYYSNVGYCILGRVIEQITQRPYEEYVREKILASCGIRHMQIGGNKESERLPDEVAYTQPDEEGWPYRIDVRRMDSHGGWVATASDLARFIVHVDRMDRVPDIIPTELLSKTYMGFKRWEHTGSLPGTATLLVRLDDEFSFVLLANRRSFKEGFWHDLSSYPETAIRTRKQWPDKDLFTKVKW